MVKGNEGEEIKKDTREEKGDRGQRELTTKERDKRKRKRRTTKGNGER